MGMQNAMWIASIFGPFMVILGLWMLLYSENLTKICNSFKTNPAAFYLMGVFNLLVGLVIINEYNMWAWNKSLLVTVLGWWLLARGVLALFMPQMLIKSSMSNPSFLKISGIIPFIWGIVLCWVAFS